MKKIFLMFCLLFSFTLAAEEVIVLDSFSFFRMHNVLNAPVITDGLELKPLLYNKSWVDRQTPIPPADWIKADFDDHRWNRGTIYSASYAPWLEKFCVRGKFTVSDPAKVKGLKLSAAFHGGAVIYVNGQEITRANISKVNGLAEPYPAEAFINSDGALMTAETEGSIKAGDPKKLMRKREITGFTVPVNLLKKGVNVIACEVIRAPYDKAVDEKKNPKNNFWNLAWNTCYLDNLQLVAADSAGLVPNVVRPDGFQIWNNNLLSNDYDMDFGDPNEKLFPVEITGAKNGSFTGKVVLGSTKPINKLGVTMGDLKNGTAVIKASSVNVRYGYPWGTDMLLVPNTSLPYSSVYPAESSLLGCISGTAPAAVPVYTKKKPKRSGTVSVPPVFGAVVPVFFTVNVPGDAVPGKYSGTAVITAEGEKPVTVSVEINVSGWKLPDTQDFRTWVEIIQSPDTLAMEYDVPLWSDRHFELIGESLKLLGGSGDRVIYIPLIAETNYGHGETMVRWVKKGENKYEYDFTPMEKYLDAAEKNMGKPKLVVFFVWDVYMMEEGHEAKASSDHEQERILEIRKEKNIKATGPIVTLLNNGKPEKLELPKYSDPESKALWKGLADEIKARMKKRGLESVMAFGMINDAWPTKADVAFWADLLPNVPWIVHAHFGAGANAYGLAKICYQIRVWSIKPGGESSLMGWKSEISNMLARYTRHVDFDNWPNSCWRAYAEYAITGDQRGVGRIGGDFWKCVKDSKGERKGRIYNRYPQSNWRNLDIYNAMLAPGPVAPGITHHYLHFMEGVQECEARIVIERALSDDALKSRLGKDLVEKCTALLTERLRDANITLISFTNRFTQDPLSAPGIAPHNWLIGSGWEERSRDIFDLAGEVEAKLSKK